MSILNWAENEVKIACSKERGNAPEGEWDYGCACYESALKAFNRLCEHGHSGMSIGITKAILDRLIDGKCLTPIDDTEDNWNEVWSRDGYVEYQCRRMSSVFKRIYKDSTVEYNDINRFVGCYEGSKCTYHSGLIDKVLRKIFPITMPYMPESKAYHVYTEDFLYDVNCGDYDTVGLLYVICPDGAKIKLNRFYKESGKDFVEITKHEYNKRKRACNRRLKKELRQ